MDSPRHIGGLPAERPWLPNLLREMADAFDLDTAMEFARLFGGRYLHLPARASAEHPVAQALSRYRGEDVLAWLIGQHDRLARIVPPRGPQEDHAQLHAMVRAMLAAPRPATVNQIAAATGLHVRRVERLLAKLREQDAAKQPGLFDERRSA